MNHPAPETWVAYVYDELEGPARSDAEAHLHVCPTCRGRVEQLRSTLVALDRDKASLVLPRRRSRWDRVVPLARWALAASVVLCAGFVAGRVTGPNRAEVRREIASAREELRAQFRDELKAAAAVTVASATDENRRLLAGFARDLETGRAADRKDLLAALDALDQRRALDTEALRAGLVTLARRTGTGFQQTESQLSLLASYLPPDPATAAPSPESNRQEP